MDTFEVLRDHRFDPKQRGALGCPVARAARAVLGTGEADARWADYQSWTKINNKPITGDHTGFIGNLHEGSTGYRQVYVNSTGVAVSEGASPYRYPTGTVVVKEQYKNSADLEGGNKPSLTIMVKISDDADNPADNWAWSRGYTKEAKTDDAFCSGCHTLAAQHDFVFSNRESLTDFR